MQGQASGMVNAENMMLATRGLEIIKQISTSVPDGQKLAIAFALTNSGEGPKAMKLLQLVAQEGGYLNDVVSAYRQLGALSFQVGEIERGRKYFSDALGIFNNDRFDDSVPYIISSTHAQTEMYWAQQEAMVSDCDAWNQHLDLAFNHVRLFVKGPNNAIVMQIGETRGYGCPPVKILDVRPLPANLR